MQTRSRASISNTSSTSLPVHAGIGETNVPKESRRTRALGDISNRIDEQPNRVKKTGKNTTKRINYNSTSIDAGPNASTDINIADDNQRVQNPRRLSARLLAKRQREDDELNAVASSASTVAQKNSDQSKKRKLFVSKFTNGQEQSKSEAKKTRLKGLSGSSVFESSAKQIDRIAKSRLVKNIDGEEHYHVHPDFRLTRGSFDGKNHTLGIPRHDRDDNDNVLKVSPYATDIFQHLFIAETKTRPASYMTSQNDINSKMRAILVDWLVEVHMKFRLVPETLYLCVNIIDRYCSRVQVQRSKLQLVGVTSLLIACKYEEIYPPEVRDCVYITDRAYQSNEVLDMEQDIVHKLAFRITVPTAYPFLQRFLSIMKAPPLVRHAASYYCERTLQEHEMLQYRPSLICASAVVLAMNHPQIAREEGLIVNNDDINMPTILLEYTNFPKEDIIACASDIAKKVALEPVTASRRQLVAVKKKYDNKKYLNISTNFELPSVCKGR